MTEKEKMSRALDDDALSDVNGGISLDRDKGEFKNTVYTEKDAKKTKGITALFTGDRGEAINLNGLDPTKGKVVSGDFKLDSGSC